MTPHAKSAKSAKMKHLALLLPLLALAAGCTAFDYRQVRDWNVVGGNGKETPDGRYWPLREPAFLVPAARAAATNDAPMPASAWIAEESACLRCGETELGWRLLETLLPGMKPEESYQGEPYVLAADVYANADMPGRAGWTWYTGAAGWFLRTAAEELLGLRFRGGELRAQPRLPASWPGYTAELRGEKGLWRAEVSRGPGDPEIRCELRNMGE